MKPTQITDLLANIKNSIVSFFSIFMFVALGVGVFLGISWARPALENAADNMFNEGLFHNYQIQYIYGLTEDDLAKLSATEGVSQVEAERQSFQTLIKDNHKYTVKVQSIGQNIDTPIIREGDLPVNEGEIALHAESARLLDIGVGDTITFEKDANESDNEAAPGAESTGAETASRESASAESASTSSASAESPSAESASAGSASAESASTGSANAEPANAEPASSEGENTSGMKSLRNGTFKVTAIVDSADYVAKASETYGVSPSPSSMVDALAWVADDAFDASAFQDGYPIVNVRCESLDGMNSFSDEYKKASDEVKEPIEALGTTLASARYDDLHNQAQKAIDEGQAQIDDAEAKIAQGEKDIADGEKQLAQARKDLDEAVKNAEAKLADAYSTLQAGEELKAEAESKLSSAKSKLNQAKDGLSDIKHLKSDGASVSNEMKSYKAEQDKLLADGKITEEEYNANLDKEGARIHNMIESVARATGDSVPSIDHTNYDAVIGTIDGIVANVDNVPVTVDGQTFTVGEAEGKLGEYEKKVSDAQSTYNKKAKELSDGWDQYYAGQSEFETMKAEGEKKIADGEKQLKDAKKTVEDAKKQVAENKPLIEEAKKELAALVKYDWSILPRAYNAGSTEVTTFGGVTGNLSISMAALFIIVGLLVSYFAVSRIVHEQVSQIGTKKALGFRQGEITKSFLWYSGLAVLAGSIAGAIIGFLLVEGIIGSVLGGMFAFGSYPAYFGWGLFLIITAIELVLVLGATYLACRKILKKHAVDLLRGSEPPTGKTRFYEKWSIWDKLPLFIQTIVNNCVNDKRRVLSTIVGVAGCTALIVTAITLNNDVLASYDRHYKNVYGFNALAYVESDPVNAPDNVESALKSQGCTTAQACVKKYLLMQPNGESGTVRIVVPTDNDAFARMYHVNSMGNGAFDPSAEGGWISQAYAEYFGAKVGDTITVDGGDGMQHEIPILGIYEFWLTYNEMVVGKDYFEKEFGTVTPNTILCQTGGTAVSDLENSVSSIEGFSSMIDDAEYQYANFDMFSQVSQAVVLIYLVLAILMAIVVLLNLNVMFIAEKKRELIVLMINGFGVKDARHYISYDNIVLTALGIIVGILLGCIMGSITVMSIEPITATFVRSPDGIAIIVGILGSAILAIIMALIALRRINKFALTDINRF